MKVFEAKSLLSEAENRADRRKQKISMLTNHLAITRCPFYLSKHLF